MDVSRMPFPGSHYFRRATVS
jgi:hypothetical protein